MLHPHTIKQISIYCMRTKSTETTGTIYIE